jgi:hypothetical protein
MPRNGYVKLIDRQRFNKKEYLYSEASPSLGTFVSSTIPLCTHTGCLNGDFNTNKDSKARAFWMTPSKMLGETSANKRGNTKTKSVLDQNTEEQSGKNKTTQRRMEDWG